MGKAFRRTKFERARPKKISRAFSNTGSMIRSLVTIGFGVAAIRAVSDSL